MQLRDMQLRDARPKHLVTPSLAFRSTSASEALAGRLKAAPLSGILFQKIVLQQDSSDLNGLIPFYAYQRSKSAICQICLL